MGALGEALISTSVGNGHASGGENAIGDGKVAESTTVNKDELRLHELRDLFGKAEDNPLRVVGVGAGAWGSVFIAMLQDTYGAFRDSIQLRLWRRGGKEVSRQSAEHLFDVINSREDVPDSENLQNLKNERESRRTYRSLVTSTPESQDIEILSRDPGTFRDLQTMCGTRVTTQPEFYGGFGTCSTAKTESS